MHSCITGVHLARQLAEFRQFLKNWTKKLTGEQKLGDMAMKIGGSVGKGQRSGQLIVFAKDKKQKAWYV